ncbi:hypothetical protein LCGC14_2883910 [marine sediment metagenome]|uniref:Uncharacterized protein n=1 Tax=marine sediment metagenome TaxID=412755 RepID=A0A0F9A7A1_9ZZZZ
MSKEIIENVVVSLAALLLAPWVVLFFVKYYAWTRGMLEEILK